MHATPKSVAATTVAIDLAKDVFELAFADAAHRIDPAIVKRDFEAAGLVFDAESPLFQNPADDHTKAVFDESIRHKTDQFMYRFRKPS